MFLKSFFKFRTLSETFVTNYQTRAVVNRQKCQLKGSPNRVYNENRRRNQVQEDDMTGSILLVTGRNSWVKDTVSLTQL